MHTTAIGNDTWSADRGPHHIRDTIAVSGELVVEAGALVCGRPGSGLIIGHGARLQAKGEEDASIVFAATDPERGWGGLIVAGSARVERARIEDAENGVWVCCTEADAVIGETTILRSRDLGVGVFRRARALVYASRIEDSGGVGLSMSSAARYLWVTRPVRIVGGASYPVSLRVDALAQLLSLDGAVDSLRGNARDTLEVFGRLGAQPMAVTPAFPWRIVQDLIVPAGGSLRLEPGSSIAIVGTLESDSGTLVVEGTEDAPVRIAGGRLTLSGYSTAPTVLEHAVFSDVYLSAREEHAVVIRSVEASGSSFRLGTPGSRITDAVIERGRAFGVHLAAPNTRVERSAVLGTHSGLFTDASGILVSAPDVAIEHCTVADSEVEGVRVEDGAGVTIRGCNFVDNVGPGVRNTSADTVNAAGNWWGDPAGPRGPAGDGAEGPVDFEPFRTEPADSAPPPPS